MRRPCGRHSITSCASNSGNSCDARIEALVGKHCAEAAGYSSVVNGRFKGGWTTRHYGRPAEGCHAIQMELAQCNYMQEQEPWQYDDVGASKLRVILGAILNDLSNSLA